MKKIYLYIITALTIFIALACEKEEINQADNSTMEILSFKTKEEFNETLNKVNQMSESERSEWEKSNGFKSYGTLSESFYYSINFDEIYTIEQLRSLDPDSIYLKIFKSSDEYHVERYEMNTKERYLMNSDKMFIIGTEVYKYFDSKLVYANISQINTLKQTKNISDIENNTSFSIKSNFRKIGNALLRQVLTEEVKTASCKTKFEAETENFWTFFPSQTKRETEFTIKNYTRGLFGWKIDKLFTDYEILLVSYDDITLLHYYLSESVKSHKIDSYNRSDLIHICEGWTNNYDPIFIGKNVSISTCAGQIDF